jgi:hypothetical protein
VKALLALALLLSLPARLSPADRTAQATLRRAVAGLENESTSPRQFERLAPRRTVPLWQRLQRKVRYPRYGAMDLAFVLAYYGVDYRQNLQRLFLPDQAWQRGRASMPEGLIGDLVILHDKHHDTASLGALLDLALDGGPAEVQEATIYGIWQQEPAMLLRVAAGSKARLGALDVMVQMEGDDLKVRRQLFAELRRFSRHPDRRVAGAARRLLSMARRDFAQERR